MNEACEYCDRDDVTLYAWHADVWCRSCIEAHAGVLEMTGSLDDAPIGRPENPTYTQPWVLVSVRPSASTTS